MINARTKSPNRRIVTTTAGTQKLRSTLKQKYLSLSTDLIKISDQHKPGRLTKTGLKKLKAGSEMNIYSLYGLVKDVGETFGNDFDTICKNSSSEYETTAK